MAIDDRYLTLISSLPAHGVLFAENKTPLSRLALNQKLKQLEAKDQKMLVAIEAILQWDKLPLTETDQQLTQKTKQLLPELPKDLQQLVLDKVDLRTVVGAMRYRQYSPDKELTGQWSISRHRQQIENHWREADFRLSRVYPWLSEAVELVGDNQIYKLEKLLLKSAWQLLNSHKDHQPFSFKSLVIYVLKWNIVERWARYNAEQARDRFQLLVKQNKPDLSGVSI